MRTFTKLTTITAAAGALMAAMVTVSSGQTYHGRWSSQNGASYGEPSEATVGIGMGGLARGAATRNYYGAGAAYDYYSGPEYGQAATVDRSYDSGQMNEVRCTLSPHSIYFEPCFNGQ